MGGTLAIFYLKRIFLFKKSVRDCGKKLTEALEKNFDKQHFICMVRVDKPYRSYLHFLPKATYYPPTSLLLNQSNMH